MDNFIAVDVETANHEPSSICAIAAVKVENGIITDRRYSLICPEPDYYHWANTRVHGITDRDTCDAPSFGTVWSQWSEWLGNMPLVAHNAPFDSRCIAAACKVYGLDAPDQFLCTVKAARRMVPRFDCPSKSLDSLCRYFGIPLRQHHNALHDAEACAKLAIILL